jgi:hypothetical protein
MCAVGFVGPTCGLPATGMQLGTGPITFSSKVDPANPNLIHFRMDSTKNVWISFMIVPTGGSFRAGDSATAYLNANNQWVMDDQFGHPYNPAMSDTTNGGQQNLMNAIAWQPTTATVSAQWSRLMSTGDAVADVIIPTGKFCLIFRYFALASADDLMIVQDLSTLLGPMVPLPPFPLTMARSALIVDTP